MNVKKLVSRLFASNWKKFSNVHQGETCYIFGDGPSIKWFDLGLLDAHPAICCGALPYHNDFHKLDARYLLIMEPWFLAPSLIQKELAQRVNAAEYRKLIARRPDIEFFLNLSNRPWLSGKNVNFVYRGLPEIRNETDRDLDKFLLFDGSFHASLALAYFMGFKKIYLFGFDAWTIQPSRNMHWYERGEGLLWEAKNFATDYLSVIARECEIFTVYFSGTSKSIQGIHYRDFTGQEPRFRENDELLSPYYMELMSTFPQFKIFPDAADAPAALEIAETR